MRVGRESRRPGIPIPIPIRAANLALAVGDQAPLIQFVLGFLFVLFLCFCGETAFGLCHSSMFSDHHLQRFLWPI